MNAFAAVRLGLALLGGVAADDHLLTPAHRYFTDAELLNQDGRPMRLYSDLIRGRAVVFNTFFTTCVGICPPLNRRMAQIQERLGDRLGKDVYLVSISVDPATDTPPRLKAYAARYQAKPGWYFLTGSGEQVRLVLGKLGHRVEAPEDHSDVLIVGNDRTGLWKKAHGLARGEDVLRVVESVVNEP